MSRGPPQSQVDLAEFPEEARSQDLDALLNQAEARLVPGQQLRFILRGHMQPW